VLSNYAVVHRPSATGPKGKALSPGVDARDVPAFVASL
jgi:hypothetical protein